MPIIRRPKSGNRRGRRSGQALLQTMRDFVRQETMSGVSTGCRGVDEHMRPESEATGTGGSGNAGR